MSGIHVLIKKDDKFLVLKTSKIKKEEPETWDLPGGSIEFGEQPIDAAIRETREEAGIDVDVNRIIGVWALEAKGNWSVELIALGTTKNDNVVVSSEHSEYMWLTLEEIKKLEPKRIHIKALLDETIVKPDDLI